jgi:hypothetical protein
MACQHSEWRDKDVEEILAAFPAVKISPKATEFRLTKGSAGSGTIELSARRVSAATDERPPQWNIQISGSGKASRALLQRLSAMREAAKGSEDLKRLWPEPTQFSAVPPYPSKFYSARSE